jgi:hypothetical protein
VRAGAPHRAPAGRRAEPPAGDAGRRLEYYFHAGRRAAPAGCRRGSHDGRARGSSNDADAGDRHLPLLLIAAAGSHRSPARRAGCPGPGALRALEAGGGLWLVVADAPLSAYGSEPIERNLRDLEWVALRGAAHARVVEYFARRTTTLPMKLFTLFNSDERALAHVRGDAAPRPAACSSA